MHNNYYLLRKLTPILESRIVGTVLSQCFSQNKDELILQFETTTAPFFIKADLLPEFSCLTFPEEFNRARKNSVDLFEPLIGRRVISVRQFTNERCFCIHFEDHYSLLFKMHGNLANLILFDPSRQVIEIFKKGIKKDFTLTLDLDREIDGSHENFINNLSQLKKVYFTLGKVCWNYLTKKGLQSLSPEEQWRAFQELILLLENPIAYYIIELEGSITFSLIHYGSVLDTFDNPITALNRFYSTYIHNTTFYREKNSLLKSLRTKLSSSENYLHKLLEKKNEITGEDQYKVWADIIMANLHQIKPSSTQITLPNFYHDNTPITIKLKQDISAQKNAALYYKKSKNQFIELKYLNNSIELKENEIKQLQNQIESIGNVINLKDLRDINKTLSIIKTSGKSVPKVPYHEFTYNSYKIWVGKNAAANDELTLKYSYKEDLWLHAKDVSGSHVLIKHQAGKIFPKDVIERAASLAAHYSKRKNEGLVPVVVTPKKFIRKRKGDLPGAVVVEREDVIMVAPST